MKFDNNKIYIIATPIGNLEDITLRAINTLKKVDMIICEDTRVSKNLLKKIGIEKPLISYNKFNEKEKLDYIFSFLQKGSIALISDAGTPLINDPGYLLIKKCMEEGIEVESLPGACSIITAITLSGIPSNRFTFLGFLDKSSSSRTKLFQEYYKKGLTLICFETSHRLLATLEDIKKVFGSDQEVVVARELTKIFQEVKKERVEELILFYQKNKAKGEIVLLLYINKKREVDLDEILLAKQEDILNVKTSKLAKDISNEFNLSKTYVYEKILEFKNKLF